MNSISLAVAAVPEGLPTVVTVALSLGVHRMARRKALVRKLSAVETLGSTSVICTDKTGTLTVGEMTVRSLYVAEKTYEVSGQGYSPDGQVSLRGKTINALEDVALRQLASICVGCNNSHLVQKGDSWQAIGDPTEAALLVMGLKTGVTLKQVDLDSPKQSEIPFDSDRKLSSAIRLMSDGQLRSFTNGAPGAVLNLSTHLYHPNGNLILTDEHRHKIMTLTSTMASQALRVLGSAYRDFSSNIPEQIDSHSVERDMVFVGLSGMHDPPRSEAIEALAQCREAGIRVVMITGDHPATAMAIARELKLDSIVAAVTGVELDKMSVTDLASRVGEISVYARVTARNKLRIVQELQKAGAVVAMTGDGVNDAPAIQGADIGIAMGKAGTEVTKQAADIIITDDNFATIVAAIEEGRGIYENIQKTLQYLLAGNVAELLLMTVCVVVGLPAPLMPIHLLWINLVTDGFPALCLATDNNKSDAMTQPPRDASEKLTNASFVLTMVVTGMLTTAVTFAVFIYTLRTSNIEYARSSAFTVLVFAELMRALGARSRTLPLWRMKPIVNVQLVVVMAISIVVQLWSLKSPILGSFLKTTDTSVQACLLLFSLGCLPMLVLELWKVLRSATAYRTVKQSTASLIRGNSANQPM
jgi:Ca2+-transporting ATPase